MVTRILVLGVLLLGCGRKHHEPVPSATSSSEALKTKHAFYLQAAAQRAQSFRGFPGLDCDALLFSGLYGSVLGVDININKFELSPGKWLRRSTDLPNCYPDEANSEISRDMLLGLMFYAWRNSRLDIVSGLEQYGKDHGWTFGEGERSRTVMTPQQMGTLYLIIDKLSGSSHPQASLPLELFHNDAGYEAHLGVIHALLRTEIYGYAKGYYLDYFSYHNQRVAQNALFSAVYHRYSDGDLEGSLAILLDEKLFPNQSLPSSLNYCEGNWLWQRDYGSDWQPCVDEPEESHSGADFLFVSDLILNH